MRPRYLADEMSNAAAPTIFTLPVIEARIKAREIVNRVSGNGSTPVVENWRQRSKGQIEFTVRKFSNLRLSSGSGLVTEVFIHRYSGAPNCDVIVKSRDRQARIRCDDYDGALKWAQIECRSYGVIAGVKIEEGEDRYEFVATNSRTAPSGFEPVTS